MLRATGNGLISIKNVFIHSFGHYYSSPSSPLPLRGAPDYSTDTVSEFHAEAHRQLHVKDLPKVLTWRLKRESNLRPSGWKSSPKPRLHHVPCVRCYGKAFVENQLYKHMKQNSYKFY